MVWNIGFVVTKFLWFHLQIFLGMLIISGENVEKEMDDPKNGVAKKFSVSNAWSGPSKGALNKVKNVKTLDLQLLGQCI